MVIIAKTKMYKNKQTAIPSRIRKEFDITDDTIIEWGISKEGKPEINFRKKELTIDDLIGIGHANEPTNAVNLKRSLYK